MITKQEARQIIKERKAQMTSEEIETKSRAIAERAFALLQAMEPTTISLYLAMPDEVQTSHLLQLLLGEGRHQLLIPRVDAPTIMRFYEYHEGKELQLSKYKIWEPMDPIEAEVVPTVMLVPGVVFDRHGGRVGHGKGFYDRYFTKHKETITHRIALAYELQLLPEVPMDEYDQPMHQIITENEQILITE